MPKTAVALTLTLIAGTAVLAHEGVENPQVKARMDLMSKIAAATKTLGQMAKGAAPFDAAEANGALEAIERHATRIPEAFETAATDPTSEALPSIWDEWEDFTTRADALEQVADRRLGTLTELRAALGDIGATCKSCHGDYRK